MNDPRPCRYCSKPLVGKRPQALYCGRVCQWRWHERVFRRLHGFSMTTGRARERATT